MSNSPKLNDLQIKLESLKENFVAGGPLVSPAPIIDAIIELTNIVADIAKNQEGKQDK